MKNKLFIGLILLGLISLVFAVKAGVTFTSQQIVNADIENFDFELTNEGWIISPDSFDFNFGYITGEKVFVDGEWNGSIITVQKYETIKYWKERYRNCRLGLTPYVYEVETGELDDLNNPVMETIIDSSKTGCITQAKKNVKQRVIDFREAKRKEMLLIQRQASDLIDVDSEWINPVLTDEELNE